ncbi:DAZ-associated protein 2 isoform X4 [Ambystoma mexicanum]|uniref:DAZ-associated protein 2 isoform X4 n=1 Tax=Ambystoma mexicanum TaxID=8296 RepID=UPI0037E8B8F3
MAHDAALGMSYGEGSLQQDYYGQYPSQPGYPGQPQNAPPMYPQSMHLPQAPPYTDAPPAYSDLFRPSYMHPNAANVPHLSSPYPGTSLYLPMTQSMPVGPMGQSMPMAYYPIGAVYPPGSTVLVDGGYDAGARFGAGATANIPYDLVQRNSNGSFHYPLRWGVYSTPSRMPSQCSAAGGHAGCQCGSDTTEG